MRRPQHAALSTTARVPVAVERSGAVKRHDFAPTALGLAWLGLAWLGLAGTLVHDCLQRVKEPVEGALQREHHLVHHLPAMPTSRDGAKSSQASSSRSQWDSALARSHRPRLGASWCFRGWKMRAQARRRSARSATRHAAPRSAQRKKHDCGLNMAATSSRVGVGSMGRGGWDRVRPRIR